MESAKNAIFTQKLGVLCLNPIKAALFIVDKITEILCFYANGDKHICGCCPQLSQAGVSGYNLFDV